MKIIWKPKNLDSIRVSCSSCGSILEISKDDLFDSEHHFDKCFKCPVCKTDIPIENGFIEVTFNELERIKKD